MRPYYAVSIAEQSVCMRNHTTHVYEASEKFYTAEYIQLYSGEHLNKSPTLLVSDFSTEVTHNRSLHTCYFPLEDPI